MPGSYLSRIGLHYSIAALLIRLSSRSRVLFIPFCAVSGFCVFVMSSLCRRRMVSGWAVAVLVPLLSFTPFLRRPTRQESGAARNRPIDRRATVKE